MAEEFEAAGIYGGNYWWNMNNINTCSSSSSSSLLCSIAANNDGGNFSCTWQTHNNLMDLKSPLVSHHHHHDSSLGFLVHEQKQNQNNESSPSSASENHANILMDSTLGFALSPSSTSLSTWNNHSSLGRQESNLQSVLEEEGGGVDSSNNSAEIKAMNQEFGIDQQQNLSYGLYGDDDEHNIIPPLHFQPAEDSSLFTNPSVVTCSYNNSTNQVSPSWSKASHDHFLKPSMPKHQLGGGFHFSNNASSAVDQSALDDVPASAHVFASSPQSQTFEHKPSFSALLTKHKREEGPFSEEAAAIFKRPRIETPSPLPTFKVRKEKLGDRITALQQLVSPFGKTDTASVLHEAIEYIKYLHDQVSVLSAPYLNNNGPAVQHYQGCDDEKESKQDLRSQGLCLAPISSTFSLANYEMMASELWTHAYEGALMR